MHVNTWLVICLLTVTAGAQSAQESSKEAGKVVHGSGCVEAGVEGGCLIVNDLKTKKTFNVRFRDKAPDIDTAISFDGTEDDNPNICMQGTAVNVTKWTVIRMHCPQASHAPHAAAQMAHPVNMGKCADWYAWYNTQPGATKSLHIAGMCTFPTSGYSVKLVPHAPQGFNPAIYLFDLVITPPQGKVSFIIRHVPVHYAEDTNSRYESVQIEPDHVTIPVHVIQ